MRWRVRRSAAEVALKRVRRRTSLWGRPSLSKGPITVRSENREPLPAVRGVDLSAELSVLLEARHQVRDAGWA
jgi:hypothetical protein